jgi:hypothetical protein
MRALFGIAELHSKMVSAMHAARLRGLLQLSKCARWEYANDNGRGQKWTAPRSTSDKLVISHRGGLRGGLFPGDPLGRETRAPRLPVT